MTKRKMGGLGKLSQFSGIKHREPEPEITESESEVKSKVQESEPIPNSELKTQNLELGQKESEQKKNNYELRPACGRSEATSPNSELKEKLVTVNIKITKSQKDWLAETATQVRDNSTEPVPPAERVYPQHLIGVAIDLLNGAEVDWTQVKNVEDLREQLNL